MDRLRIDKWLWAARFFKTRSLAARACELGRVEYKGQLSKPSREIQVGDCLRIKTEGGVFEVHVMQLSEQRGPAPVAQMLYRETEESKAARAQAAEERKLAPRFETVREGRPSKRDRRKIDRLRQRQ